MRGRWGQGGRQQAGRAPRARGGFELKTRWSKNEKHLQSLHTGERVFGDVLFVHVFIIT